MTNSKSWITASLKPNQDKIAIANLQRQNFEYFQPKFVKTSRVRNKFTKATKPVFPGYIFIAVSLERKNWYTIKNTRGITKVIAFENYIPIIPTKLIDGLKKRFPLTSSSDLGTSNTIDQLTAGTTVEITNGPFAQIAGRIQEIEADKRIWILMDILGSLTRVLIDGSDLSRIK